MLLIVKSVRISRRDGDPTLNRCKPMGVLTRTKSPCSDDRLSTGYSLADLKKLFCSAAALTCTKSSRIDDRLPIGSSLPDFQIISNN